MLNVLLQNVHRCGTGGRMRACRAAGPGSIPGRDKFQTTIPKFDEDDMVSHQAPRRDDFKKLRINGERSPVWYSG